MVSRNTKNRAIAKSRAIAKRKATVTSSNPVNRSMVSRNSRNCCVFEPAGALSHHLPFSLLTKLDNFLTIDDLVKETNPYNPGSAFYYLLSGRHCTRCDIGFASSLSKNGFEREVRPCPRPQDGCAFMHRRMHQCQEQTRINLAPAPSFYVTIVSKRKC